MAKLNITFVNEVGNNLNRYKAIDVNTGDEYLFDLSRNGTITIPGTPLNAEIMNEIVSAINEQFSNLVVTINDTTPSDTKYPSEKAVVDYVGQIANEESVNVSDNVLIKISGVSDNLALPPESQMEVNSIEGNSIVRNQLYNKDYYQDGGTSNGITPTNNNDGSITLSGTAENDGNADFYFCQDNKIRVIKGHKYVVLGDNVRAFQNLSIAPNSIGEATDNGYARLWIRIPVSQGQVVNIKVYPKFIDLTQWFGSNDNIPQDILNTPSNFFKHYKGSLAYDTGHIENGSGNLVDTNRNIWDEEWEVVNVSGNQCITNKNLIRVIPNTIYHINTVLVNNIICYDINGNKLGSATFDYASNPKYNFSIIDNTAFIKFYLGYEYGTTYNHDICINESDTKFNGTYVAHIKNTLNLGNDILRSAGNARDKKTYDGEIERKVGRVDLGTLDWAYSDLEGHKYFHANIVDIVVGQSTGIPNIICSKYIADTDDNVYKNINDKTISIMNTQQRIFIYDSTYTDAATFKAAMSGVYLNYELETPTTEQGTPYNNHLPVYYGGQEFTTGDVPFVINKNYDISIKDQVITNVRVDKEQSEQIHALENVNREQSNAIDSLQNKVSNLETTQEAHSTSISSLNTKITDLESYKFDSSKLTLQQNLIKTKLLYDGVVISEVNSADVMVTPKIYISVERVGDSSFNEILKVVNDTSYDMYVSMNGQGTHSKFNVPSGLTKTSSKTVPIGAELIPENYTANIELEVYFNSNRTYNDTVGSTMVKNKKIINLFADVTTTNK